MRIDLRQIMPRIMTSDDAQNAFLVALATKVQAKWRQKARMQLGCSSRSITEYVNNVQIDMQGTKARIVLSGLFPNMLEQGMGPNGVGSQGIYDLRKFLLQASTRNIHSGKNGLYLNVPFHHSMASIARKGGDLDVKSARALRPSTSMMGPGGTRLVSQGGRMVNPKAPNQRPNDILVDGVIFPAHATGPHNSMVRNETQYQITTRAQSGYMTWRRVSAGGKPWMTQGIAARNIAPQVVSLIPRMLEGAL